MTQNIYVDLALKTLYGFVMMAWSTILAIVRLIVPYQYRCKSVNGEIVLVTGAGSGIGRLMSKKLAKLGAKLVLVDVNSKGNEETAKEIEIEGGTAHTFTCDLSSREDIYRAADQVFILIHNRAFFVLFLESIIKLV